MAVSWSEKSVVGELTQQTAESFGAVGHSGESSNIVFDCASESFESAAGPSGVPVVIQRSTISSHEERKVMSVPFSSPDVSPLAGVTYVMSASWFWSRRGDIFV